MIPIFNKCNGHRVCLQLILLRAKLIDPMCIKEVSLDNFYIKADWLFIRLLRIYKIRIYIWNIAVINILFAKVQQHVVY